MTAKSWTQERAKIASLSRFKKDDDPAIIKARQNLKALKLEEHVRNVVNEAPPLTAEQADRIAKLLSPTQGGGC
ncbi:MAG: hypothetical protein HLX51_06490 [Micrococcaceae bacterium]|nr:hypothetical protein [Micrococcaceae bacterium]